MKFPVAFALFATAATAAAQLSNEYLPPNVGGGAVGGASYNVAASAPAPQVAYAAPAASYSAPAAAYSAPAASYEESYDVGASAPAHSFSADDGYRYKTQRRRVVKVARRHRRDVAAEYLPPVASAPAASYAAPAASYSAPAASYSAPAASYSAPAASYSAPAASYEESYDVGASAPAHSYSADDGYRYKTQRRRVVKVARRHRF